MKTHDQNKAIAEYLGYEVLLEKPGLSAATGLACKNMYRIRGKTDWMIMPDWTADLNAMFIAEESLSETQMDDYYYDHLHEKDTDHSWTAHHPASRRAEAFLKTIDKWVD